MNSVSTHLIKLYKLVGLLLLLFIYFFTILYVCNCSHNEDFGFVLTGCLAREAEVTFRLYWSQPEPLLDLLQ